MHFLKISREKTYNFVARYLATQNSDQFFEWASESTDDFVPAACQRCAQFANNMPLECFLKGEKSILKTDVFLQGKDQIYDVITSS